MAIISQSAAYLDKILLFNFIGPSQLAVYSFAQLLPEQVQTILGNISALALPKFAPKSREEIRMNIMKKIKKLFFLAGAVMALYIIIVPYFYRIFFPQYLNAVPYSQVMIFSLIAFPISLLGTTFEAKMMKKELYLIKLKSFARVMFMAVLIPFYGIWGAIFATLGADIFGIGLILFLFRKF